LKEHKKKVDWYLADPLKGFVSVSSDEFFSSWASTTEKGQANGIALILEPTPVFYTKKEEKGSLGHFPFLMHYIKPYRPLIHQLGWGLLTGSLLQLLLPFLTQSIVDHGISEQHLSFIHLVLIAQLILVLSATSVEFIRGWILLHIGSRINISLISDFLSKLMKLPMAFFDGRKTGDLMQRIYDHHRIEDFLTNAGLNTLFSLFNVFIFGIVLVVYNWKICLVFFTGSLLYVLWVNVFMKQRKKIDYNYFDKQSANQSQLIQLVSAMQDIKLHGCERKKRWEWERLQTSIFHLRTKALALRQYQDSGAILFNQSKNALITAMAAGYVLKGEMTLGMMLSVQYIIGQLNAPIDQLIQFMRSWQDARLSLNRLAEIHVQPEEERPMNNYTCLNSDTLNKDLQVNQLDFTYDGLHPVLQQINLTIPRGKQTAIVGMSGSGKTTLIKLLLGYYPPTGGDILIDEISLSNYSMADWRSHCGVVMQDGYLFSDTIAGNMAPGEEDIDMERLQYASRLTNMDEFIRSLPLGYNTLIGPEGMNLSQGQKQRILIGRAIYKNPALLFLDEATNALDANNEREIMERLQPFFTGRTVITVAHRLSTVRQADQIVVIHKGSIAESGTHEELIKVHGYYYQLVKNQLEL
jgi:ATP-binding cassette subfamily B protein